MQTVRCPNLTAAELRQLLATTLPLRFQPAILSAKIKIHRPFNTGHGTLFTIYVTDQMSSRFASGIKTVELSIPVNSANPELKDFLIFLFTETFANLVPADELNIFRKTGTTGTLPMVHQPFDLRKRHPRKFCQLRPLFTILFPNHLRIDPENDFAPGCRENISFAVDNISASCRIHHDLLTVLLNNRRKLTGFHHVQHIKAGSDSPKSREDDQTKEAEAKTGCKGRSHRQFGSDK